MHFDLQVVITNFFSIIISLTVHEYAHAYVANRMGDPTPARFGRLNLNPITIIKAHPFGALIIPLIGSFNGFLLGWAATPVNPHLVNRKYTLRQAERWISIAGPLSNVIFAILCALLYTGLSIFAEGSEETYKPILHLSQTLVFTNVFLALFNMIPIPPFDGFTVLSSSLPNAMSEITTYLEQYGNMILLFVFYFGGRILSPLIIKISTVIFDISRGVVGLLF
jgi:Zn-dependent protease